MIEKLKYIERQTCGEDMVLRTEKIPVQPWEMQDKINEIIGVVNELVLCEQAKTCYELTHKDKTKDTSTEQKKWIGKLCRFWDFVYDHDYFDILKGITDDGLFIGHNGTWKHCEPIKSDNDIIFKGDKE